MLVLRFGLENHASFRDPTELSFVATSQEDEPDLRFSAPPAAHGVLPVLGLWGPNASGKTRLLEAFQIFRDLIKYSFSGWEPQSPLPWRPFAMRTGEDAPPTRMDLDFVIDGIRHHYGMAFNAGGFVEEWLFHWPKNRQVLFHRNHREEDPWYFGPSFRGQKQAIVKSTRRNSLFLSCAAQFNHEQLTRIYSAIVESITMEQTIMLQGYPIFQPKSVVVQPEFRPMLLEFLAAADLGIVDIEIREHEAPRHEDLDKILKADVLAKLRAREQEEKFLEVHFIHGDPFGPKWTLSPWEESRGTSILLRRLEDIITSLQQGGIVVFDEIDTSLHPELSALLVQLFCNPEVNKNQAQLIFSTHNRSLMNQLRRDEVVLLDKDRDGSSSLRAASEYQLRGREDLKRAYERGRIRGVPVLGDLANIVQEGLGGQAPR